MHPVDPPAPERVIVGFHQDAAGDWVAELACGHQRHVRHDPPLESRPWVAEADGRRSRLGSTLPCLRCLRGEPARSSGP